MAPTLSIFPRVACFCLVPADDLFGLAIVVYDGTYRRSRARIVAFGPADGEKLMAMMATRRATHGYQRAGRRSLYRSIMPTSPLTLENPMTAENLNALETRTRVQLAVKAD